MSDKALEERRVANIGKQVDNASLPAGSAMYYYCRGCGATTAVLPEDWFQDPPPKLCAECLAMPELPDDYDAWLRARGEKPVPR